MRRTIAYKSLSKFIQRILVSVALKKWCFFWRSVYVSILLTSAGKSSEIHIFRPTYIFSWKLNLNEASVEYPWIKLLYTFCLFCGRQGISAETSEQCIDICIQVHNNKMVHLLFWQQFLHFYCNIPILIIDAINTYLPDAFFLLRLLNWTDLENGIINCIHSFGVHSFSLNSSHICPNTFHFQK